MKRLDAIYKSYESRIQQINEFYGLTYFDAIKTAFADRLKNHSLQIIVEMGVIVFTLYSKTGRVSYLDDLPRDFKIVKELKNIEESLPYQIMGTQSYKYIIGKAPKIERHLQWIEPALQGKKIHAIKALRGLPDTPISLKESIYFIDSFMSLFPPNVNKIDKD